MDGGEKTLSEGELDRIEVAVETAEKTTSGEILPVVLARSDNYPGARWRMAILVAGLAAFLLWCFLPHLHPMLYLVAEAPGLLLGYALGSMPALQRAFLARAEMEEEVDQRALELFHLRGVGGTRDRAGVLILVSLLERRVRILADDGIDAKTERGEWDRVTEELVQRIRAGHLADGLCDAILRVGALQARHFPGRPDDRNELPDRPTLEG